LPAFLRASEVANIEFGHIDWRNGADCYRGQDPARGVTSADPGNRRCGHRLYRTLKAVYRRRRDCSSPISAISAPIWRKVLKWPRLPSTVASALDSHERTQRTGQLVKILHADNGRTDRSGPHRCLQSDTLRAEQKLEELRGDERSGRGAALRPSRRGRSRCRRSRAAARRPPALEHAKRADHTACRDLRDAYREKWEAMLIENC
jgi:hypothetical protein